MMSDDLRLLAGVLEDSTAELEAAGVIDPRDEGYARVRLGLAATILGRAWGGESDPAELRRFAVGSFARGAAPRRGGSGDETAVRRSAADPPRRSRRLPKRLEMANGRAAP
jgi:hypothetical protein